MKAYVMHMNYNSNLVCSHIFHERFVQNYWENQYLNPIGRKDTNSFSQYMLSKVFTQEHL